MSSAKRRLLALAAASLLAASARAAQEATVSDPKIRPKDAPAAALTDSELTPDNEVVDAPTTGVLDDHGYSSRSRFGASGGLTQYLAFGVYPGVNLGASAAIDGLIGSGKNVRMRTPTLQLKWRFFEGDQTLPSLAMGFDGQGYLYNVSSQRFNQRQRGFYVVASKELGLPGLMLHPSFNVSDFNSNAIFGSLPLTLNLRDQAELLLEWDNIADWSNSRLNAGIRAYLSANFHVDFAVRAIAAGGTYSDGAPRGPERIVQLIYTSSF